MTDSIEIAAVGGYNEVGRQCTAIRVGKEVILVDLGLHLDHYIAYTDDEEEDINTTSARGLREAGAVPDYQSIKDWRKMVKAIVITHAHLDHVGAVPYLASMYDCPVYGSPFTIALLKQLIADKEMDLPNELIPVERDAQLTPSISCELIHMTHSTVDCRLVALHTPAGIVTIDNDYKVDINPPFGPKPDVKRLEKLSGKIIAHIGECLYAPEIGKTPSESVARQMLEDILLQGDFENRAVFVSTFSSHISRLYSIIQIGKAMGREVVFLGRSMSKYLAAADEVGILSLPDHVEVIKYGSQIKRFFRKHKDLSNFLIVCTGHMGEPKAALSKLAQGKYPFRFKPGDVVVLSSRAIPVASIIANRQELERKLKDKHVRIYSDVHVSGHASREDIRWLLNILKPKNVIPNHGTPEMTKAFIDLAKEMGISSSNIHNLNEGDRLVIKS